MSTTIALPNGGSLTLPPSLRRIMGLDKLRNPMVVIEKRDGGFSCKRPLRCQCMICQGTIEQWIARDEADIAALHAPQC